MQQKEKKPLISMVHFLQLWLSLLHIRCIFYNFLWCWECSNLLFNVSVFCIGNKRHHKDFNKNVRWWMLFYAGNRYNLEQNSCYISDCMITVVQYCGGGTLERNSIIKLGLVIGGNTVLYPSLCINENVLQCIKQASHAKKYSVM